MDDAKIGGGWVTGNIGDPFEVDAEEEPIPNAPPEQPTETIGVKDSIETNALALHASEFDPVLLDFPDSSPQMIGGNDDETQKEIREQMERGEFGADAGSIPEDAETSI